MALVDKTISSGDLKRMMTKISLAITDALFDREENNEHNNEEGRTMRAKQAATKICETFGITVIE